MRTQNLQYFKTSYLLFKEYYIANGNSFEQRDRELAVEAQKRILQLDYTYSLIKKLDKEVIDFVEIQGKGLRKSIENNSPKKKLTESEWNNHRNDIFLLELHTEHFYYISFRLRNIIRYLPGLGKKFESEGIRNVRNLIIEHPQTEQIYANGFICASVKKGPSLKNFRPETDNSYKDKGLYINAAEFKKNFDELLKKTLANRC